MGPARNSEAERRGHEAFGQAPHRSAYSMKKRILLIDDEPQFVELITLRLEANQYEVLTASDGQEGVNKALREKPDLIFLDIMMPQKEGFEVLPQLKHHQQTRLIPVIMLTAKADTRSILESKKLGATDYLIKPVDSNELLAAIQRYVS